ncbi:unnamed protein product [Lactuca saligna]|uniref:Uncharacterized protein n=1 Tax=Lactuca saligna TaxID=75948 RepID=A0AA35ZIE9_LACSI|nr:unnamed protein product [Lactuca saligna]
MLYEQNSIVACEKAALEDHVATLEDQVEQHENQVNSLAREKGALDVVRVMDKVIETMEFSSGIQGMQKACEDLELEKGKQLAYRPTTSSDSDAPDPGFVSRRAKEVDISFSSLAETDFVGHFHLGELNYDSFCQFYRRPGPGSSSSDSRD